MKKIKNFFVKTFGIQKTKITCETCDGNGLNTWYRVEMDLTTFVVSLAIAVAIGSFVGWL